MPVKDQPKQNLPVSGTDNHLKESGSIPSSEEELWNLIEDSHEKTRDWAVKQLVNRLRLNPGDIQRKLRHHHWFVRCAALVILGKRKDPRFLENVIPLFKDRNVEVRKTAAWALGEIGGDECLKLLMPMLRDANRFVCLEAEKAIEKASRLKFT